jgi:hypothetical protein
LGEKTNEINMPKRFLIPPFPGSSPGAPASYSFDFGLFFGRAIFAANWRAFLVCYLPQRLARSHGLRDAKNLSRAISWLTFLLQPKALRLRGGMLTIRRLVAPLTACTL